MSVAGIFSNSISTYNPQSVQTRTQQFQQEFQQLGQDLQAGTVTAAQQDYANLHQDFQNQEVQNQGAHLHHHHHHHGGGSQGNAISQMFQQLGQDLQSGQLSAAQQAYSTLQQDLQQFVATNGTAVTQSGSSASSIALSA